MNDIAKTISKSIKEAKWLKIEYLNKNSEKTRYWCAIIDIDIEHKAFDVYSFNSSKITSESNGVIGGKIYFDGIKEAVLVEGTYYDVPDVLIFKIESNISKLNWLKYDSYDENILNYLKTCIIYDHSPYQEKSVLVSGIDQSKFKECNQYKLSPKQIIELTKGLEIRTNNSKNNKNYKLEKTDLCLNLCSIFTNKGLFVVAYKKIFFNPSIESLVLSDSVEFNYEFTSKDKDAYKHNLRNYLDYETEYFTELFIKNKKKAILILEKTLRKYEKIDEEPWIMDMRRTFSVDIEKEYNNIAKCFQEDKLSTPLKSFFGNMSTTNLGKKKNIEITCVDDKVDNDQLRVVYNAMKQPVTIVQGPPGSGKTQSILNIIISCLCSSQKVMVSSNNNKPIDDIYKRMFFLKYYGRNIPIPVIRLGNNEHVLESLKILKENIEKYRNDFFRIDENKLKLKKAKTKDIFMDLNKAIEKHERYLEIQEKADILEKMLKIFERSMKSVVLQELYDRVLNDKKEIKMDKDIIASDFISIANKDFFMWLYFTSLKSLKELSENDIYIQFLNILEIENDQEKVSKFNKYIANDDNLTNLLKIFPIVMTTNMSASRLGSPNQHFDLTIIDEASQCSIGYSLVPILRAKRLLLIGDQNQLKPVIGLDPILNKKLIRRYETSDVYDYTKNSILSVYRNVDPISKDILLRFHYRSRPKIIAYSNKKYYNKELIVVTKDDLTQKSLSYIDAREPKNYCTNTANISTTEVSFIIEDIKKRRDNRCDNTIGVITPFRNQATYLEEEIKREKIEGVQVGTIHTFQGNEKDIIYLSSCITPRTNKKAFNWLKNNKELINVATTRAKEKLIIVGDEKLIKKMSDSNNNDYYELLKYVKNNGEEISFTDQEKEKVVSISSYKQYNTKSEDELLRTIKHFLTTVDNYDYEKQVNINSILGKYIKQELYDFGLKSRFDFVLFKKVLKDKIPVLVIELDGPEHYNDSKVQERDRKKEEICKLNNIKMIRIKNDFSRRYEFIRDIIIDILK